jgi:Formate hydrogenlyase subunit 6/NADH:ubiquinone oxidoreductase 23 kD subunit (chain I)
MIFYFSGTGNSLHVAKGIGASQKEKLVSIADESRKSSNMLEYTFAKGELLGFVFPVYAWGPPRIVLDFIRRMSIEGESPYVFSVCTCGDEEGGTTHLMQKTLARKGLKLNCAFTIQMPNNFIIMGYDVVSADLERGALQAAEGKLSEINDVLSHRQVGVYRLISGKAAAIKTTLAHPLFNQFALNTKKFHATDSCTRCKLCERICPVQTIVVTDKPSWGNACTHCLACINRCPARAIQYGNDTIRKGRYVHPDLR